jgi:SAM-dependent methyltransferase
MNDPAAGAILEREKAYHEKLYSGEAQAHFARPAVRAFRQHLIRRILRVAGASRNSRVLSLGCGIGDTELLLAPHVSQVVGVDLSPSAIRQARADAQQLGVANAEFIEGTAPRAGDKFDAVIAIFFLHHLPDALLADLPGSVADMLHPGGTFYSLDPSVRRLSATVGRLLIPNLMKKYQSEDERELKPEAVADSFRRAGFSVECDTYDFGSTPVAGLFPGWRFAYQAARRADDWLLRVPFLRQRGSNFAIIARKDRARTA